VRDDEDQDVGGCGWRATQATAAAAASGSCGARRWAGFHDTL
jgi:hypothetical protein